jgi:hypothetical protein
VVRVDADERVLVENLAHPDALKGRSARQDALKPIDAL